MPTEDGEKVETLIGVSFKCQGELKLLKKEYFDTDRASYLQVIKKLIDEHKNNRSGRR